MKIIVIARCTLRDASVKVVSYLCGCKHLPRALVIAHGICKPHVVAGPAAHGAAYRFVTPSTVSRAKLAYPHHCIVGAMQIPRSLRDCYVWALLCLCHGAPGQAQAQDAPRCSDAMVQRIGKHFGLTGFSYPNDNKYPSQENGGLIFAGTCKPWPGNPSRTLAAFAYDAGVEYEKQLLIAVVEGPGHRVVASYKSVIDEDAATQVENYSLVLDTARYTLSPSVRAFGLRLNTFHERCGYEGGLDNELTLYVIDGSKIRPVLTQTMHYWRYGNATTPGGRCSGEEVPQADANIQIAVEPTRSHGFADLRLTAKRDDQPKALSRVVKYNGERYELAPWNAVLEAWWR